MVKHPWESPLKTSRKTPWILEAERIERVTDGVQDPDLLEAVDHWTEYNQGEIEERNP